MGKKSIFVYFRDLLDFYGQSHLTTLSNERKLWRCGRGLTLSSGGWAKARLNLKHQVQVQIQVQVQGRQVKLWQPERDKQFIKNNTVADARKSTKRTLILCYMLKGKIRVLWQNFLPIKR